MLIATRAMGGAPLVEGPADGVLLLLGVDTAIQVCNPHGNSTYARRVNGNLNLSRAIGDLKYKGNDQLAPDAQIITAQPDIVKAGPLSPVTFTLSHLSLSHVAHCMRCKARLHILKTLEGRIRQWQEILRCKKRTSEGEHAGSSDGYLILLYWVLSLVL